MTDNDIILIQEINRLKANLNFDTPKRIESLIARIESHPLWRYHKDGEIDQFSYVEWNDKDSFGYEVTMFLPL